MVYDPTPEDNCEKCGKHKTLHSITGKDGKLTWLCSDCKKIKDIEED